MCSPVFVEKMVKSSPVVPRELIERCLVKPVLRKLSISSLEAQGLITDEERRQATLAFYTDNGSLIFLNWHGRIVPRGFGLKIFWDSKGLGIDQVVVCSSTSKNVNAVVEPAGQGKIYGELFKLTV